MSTTILTVESFVVIVLVEVALAAYFLRLGSCWAKIGNVGFFRAVWAVVAASIVSWIPTRLLPQVPVGGVGRTIVVLVLQLVLMFGLTWFVIARVLKTGFWRAAWAWTATLVPAASNILLVVVIVRPYMFEAFTTPTNSMAPTILGRHWEATCPRCGSPAYATPEPNDARSPRPVLMICAKELRSCEVANPTSVEHRADKFLVNKLISPRRWDVIVFRYPADPTIYYCKRLVGLPGETVAIHDGAVWIDGKRQSPPNGLDKIEYLDQIAGWPQRLWGSRSMPAKLGPGEYFVLGDFSANAMDSRLWQQGAPGHPPYAVPESYLTGVVTHIYWPPSRWCVLR
ncbi:MAG: signal peptidase I [Planctomycetaceae bacterium]|nr:signal peptidase I [Planctomycetaceae bacterium]